MLRDLSATRWLLLLPLSVGLFVQPALAGELRRCEGRVVRYVTGDCPAGTRQAWTQAFQPDPPADAATRKDERAALEAWRQANRAEVAGMLRHGHGHGGSIAGFARASEALDARGLAPRPRRGTRHHASGPRPHPRAARARGAA